MRKQARWLGLLCAVGVGFVVASCAEEVPTALDENSTQAVTETASPPEAMPLMGEVFLEAEDNCLNDLPGEPDSRFNNPTCRANDVEIKVLQVVEVNGAPHEPGVPIECVEGTELEVQMIAFFGINATERYDVGYYLALDGGDAVTGQCFHGNLEPASEPATPLAGPPYSGPYRDLEPEDAGDVCGDIAEEDEVPLFGQEVAAIRTVPATITLICTDPDDDGNLEVGTCTSWDNNDKETCEGVADAVPGTPAKCNCDPAFLPVNIRREATVEVVKDLIPEADAGTFDLVIKDWEGTTVASATAVGDGGSAGPHTFQWFKDDEPTENKASVAEPGANLGSLDENSTPSAFDYYTTTYSCVESNNGNGPVSGSGTGPVNLTLQSNDAWVCTFTNTRIPPPAVTVTKDATESFDRAWSWQLAKRVYKNGAVSPAEVCSTLGDDIEDTTQILQLGQDLTACYVVTATPGGPTDTNHKVSGTINVSMAASTAPYTANITVTDLLTPGDIGAIVDCDGTAGDPTDNVKTNVAPGGSFSCTYAASMTETQADALTLNTATAAVAYNTGDNASPSPTGTAAVDFSTATPTTETDESADVTDTWYNQANFNLALGILAADGVDSWTFDRDLTCPDYGDTLIENDAFLLSNDGGYDLTADADVTVSCAPPPSGCVLTQGFWKTHSEFGPAPYADGWEQVVGATECADPSPSANASGVGADVLFGMDETGTFTINSGMCYNEVQWTQGKAGNPWYKVAHQYIAAWLNVNAGGADPAVISNELAAAADLLEWYDGGNNILPKKSTAFCDAQVSGDPAYALGCFTGGSFNSDRQFANYLNSRLTSYNEGDLGVPHCDDDAQSLATSQ